MTDLNNVVFIDTETTGLDPDRHEIWELALITGAGEEHLWHLPVDLAKADLIALNIGGYFDRYGNEDNCCDVGIYDYGWDDFCADMVTLTRGKHLVGAIPSFDAQRLERLLRAHGSLATWHYHLIDIEALAVGYLIGKGYEHVDDDPLIAPPWNSDDLSAMLGINRDDYQKHSALGDARWAAAIYEHVMDDAG